MTSYMLLRKSLHDLKENIYQNKGVTKKKPGSEGVGKHSLIQGELGGEVLLWG